MDNKTTQDKSLNKKRKNKNKKCHFPLLKATSWGHRRVMGMGIQGWVHPGYQIVCSGPSQCHYDEGDDGIRHLLTQSSRPLPYFNCNKKCHEVVPSCVATISFTHRGHQCTSSPRPKLTYNRAPSGGSLQTCRFIKVVDLHIPSSDAR